MSTIVEIDKAGRIVVPKKLRDALHLIPGTRLSVEQRGGGLLLEPDLPEPQLVMNDGMWVISGLPRFANESAAELIDEQRERRMRFVSGLSDQP